MAPFFNKKVQGDTQILKEKIRASLAESNNLEINTSSQIILQGSVRNLNQVIPQHYTHRALVPKTDSSYSITTELEPKTFKRPKHTI